MDKQGLLIARQNQRMGVYPLIYDQAGSSEWVLGPGGIVEDTFFAELYESTGGQCLGCPPPDDPPQMNPVGKIAMLMDSEGLVQVKIDDGLFKTYELLEFGYGSRDIGGFPPHRVPDLSGRWALVEDVETSPYTPPADPGNVLIPSVLDIKLESVTVVPVAENPPPTAPGYVMFSIRDKVGNEYMQMKCDYDSDWENIDADLVCKISNMEINNGDTLFRVKMLSPERLSMVWVGPEILEIPPSELIAVRVD